MKKSNLRKWVLYLLVGVNFIILNTISNNSITTDLILMLVFVFNSMLVLKYDHKYINKGDDYND